MTVSNLNFETMKLTLLLLTFFTFTLSFTQDIVQVSGKGKLIADFKSSGESPNVKGLFLEQYQTLVSIISGTQTVKCMVRIGGTVNVIGQWEMNDLNDVIVKVYEVEMEAGKIDILLVGITDGKAISMNLLRKSGEDMNDLGFNYIEQQVANKPMIITIGDNRVQIVYDNGTEKPFYGLVGGVFREIY